VVCTGWFMATVSMVIAVLTGLALYAAAAQQAAPGILFSEWLTSAGIMGQSGAGARPQLRGAGAPLVRLPNSARPNDHWAKTYVHRRE
jgi:hypothetical protein